VVLVRRTRDDYQESEAERAADLELVANVPTCQPPAGKAWTCEITRDPAPAQRTAGTQSELREGRAPAGLLPWTTCGSSQHTHFPPLLVDRLCHLFVCSQLYPTARVLHSHS